MDDIIITSMEDEDFSFIYQTIKEAEEDIRLIINTDGGNSHNLLALAELILNHEKQIYTHVVGRAFSAGAILAACGWIGGRTVSPIAGIMMHNTQFAFEVGGLNNHARALKDIQRMNKTMYEMLAEHTGKKKNYYTRLLRNDIELFMTPEQAVKHGIFDRVEIQV